MAPRPTRVTYSDYLRGRRSTEKLARAWDRQHNGGRKFAKPSGPARPAVTSAPRPAAPPDPYAAYKGIPGAVEGFQQIDRDQEYHADYARKVGAWQSTALTGLAGFNQEAQSNYTNFLGGGGPAGVAAAITPGSVQGSPGGIVAGNNNYLVAAGQQASAAQGSVARQIAQYQGTMNQLQPNTLSQGFINSMADYAKGLPSIYAERRREWTDKVNELQAEIAKAEETARANKVRESIDAWNAQTQAAIAFGNLGIRADDQAFDQIQATAGQGAPVPPGFVRLPDGDVVRDPTYDNGTGSGGSGGGGGGTSTRDGQGRLRLPKLQEDGYTRFGDKPPKKYDKTKFRVVPGADGGYWIKRITGTAAKPAAGTKPFDLQTKLQDAVDGSLIGDEQNVGTPDILRFLREHQPSRPADFAAWYAEVLPVLGRVDERYPQWVGGWVLRRKKEGAWKGRF